MDYLISLGHRRIGFISGRPDLQSAARRLQGYKDGLARAGIPLDAELIQAGDFTREAGLACARRLLNLSDPPTAILASNDGSAIGAIKAIHEAGLRVPDDVSVVGCDNVPDAAYTHPGLTTVDQSIDAMGYIAAQILIRLIEGDTRESDLYKVPTRLIVTDSCRAVTDHAPLESVAYDGEPRAIRIPGELRIRDSTAGVDRWAAGQVARGGDAYWRESSEVVRWEFGHVPIHTV